MLRCRPTEDGDRRPRGRYGIRVRAAARRTTSVERTSFVGRADELTLVRGAFGASRLVTLVGPGGVGKSRTALRAAEGLRDRFADGVWLAELSALGDPELVPATLAAVFELPEQSGMAPLDAVVAHVRGRRLLIVLDTCEHLLDACATLCDIVLREAGDVCVLATSRQPLDAPGERCLSIAPLTSDDALELFVQRAASASPGFTATPPTGSSSARSSGGWTGSRWRWSWPRCGCGPWRSRTSWAASTTASRCSPAGAARPSPGTRRCARRSTGRTNCARRTSGCCGRGCRCSRAPSSCRRPSGCARAANSPATGCWRR
ncbi:hypothetical protein NKH77_48265 [Streptomyces sp. M19]